MVYMSGFHQKKLITLCEFLAHWIDWAVFYVPANTE